MDQLKFKLENHCVDSLLDLVASDSFESGVEPEIIYHSQVFKEGVVFRHTPKFLGAVVGL